MLPFAVLLLFLAGSVQSQTPLNSYTFQNISGSYTEITGGIILGSASNDDQRFVDPANLAGGTATTGPGFPIGFSFVFGGVVFDRLAINNNGWISLGQSALTPSVNNASTSANLPISSIVGITPPILVSRIAGMALDLQGQTGSELRMETIGTAPSRECVIQWKNYREYGSTGQSYNFQIRLMENGNIIQLIYGSFTNNATYTVQVGLRGEPATTATNYHNRTTTSNWMATTQGGSATANCSFSATVFPAQGTTFIFTPPSGPPGCANLVSPADLSTMVPATATLNWAAGTGGTPDYYKLYFGTDNPPTNLHNGSNVGMATTYDPIPDMNYLTPYFWKIVPTNANGEAQGCPVWTFTTGPDPSIQTFPSCESFDNPSFPPYGWSSVKTAGTGTPGTWDRQVTGTNPACSSHSGAGMTRYNSYNLANGTAGILVTPPVNFPSDLYRVEFWMYRDDGYPSYNNELINVYYNTGPDLNGAMLLGTIHRYVGFDPVETTANQWYQYYFDMPAGTGGANRYVIFEAVSQYGNNMFIDDICLVAQPVCPAPSSLSAATTAHTALLGWNSNGIQWDVEYGTSPYNFTGIPSFTTNSNPHLLGNLASGSQYVYKVRSTCLDGTVSLWSSATPFITSCDSTTVPYVENFDNVTAPAVPACITVTNNNGDAVQWKTVTSNPYSPPNAMNISYNTTLAMDDWFFSRGLWLDAGTTYEVSFRYRAQSATYPERLQVLWGSSPDAGGMTGGLIWDNNSITNVTYRTGSGAFTPTVSGIHYIGWHGYSDVNMYQLYVDDIAVIKRKYYLVPEVYYDPALQDGDTIRVIGEYAAPVLVSSYLDQICNQLKTARSQILLEGLPLPDSADHGGLVAVRGAIRFVTHPDPVDDGDSLLAILNITEYQIYITGWDTTAGGSIVTPVPEDQNMAPEACDPCKFAILISGGYNHANNPPKYYKELADLYKLKVDNQGYCPENVYVHYYHGKDSLKATQTQIPAGRIFPANKGSISTSFAAVAGKVKQCTDSGKPATFQKMVTNHGDSTGKIVTLEGSSWLKPEELKSMQQAIIDSCCSTVYDEFLQCYPGYSVDAARSLNNRGKATIYANAPADRSSTWSNNINGSVYLAAKINALKAGKSYPAAVAAAQSAYDQFIRQIRSAKAAWKQELQDDASIPNRDTLLGAVTKTLEDLDKGIGKSRNVTVHPMKTYCEWKEFVIPPGGQLVLEFEGDRKNCGNVTVNIVDPVSGVVKEHSFNWNIPGSWRYSPGKERRVINGHPTLATTVKVHNDNKGPGFTMTGSVNHNNALAQSISNAIEYPGFSFGGSDQSSGEFGTITQSYLLVEHIDQLPFYLNQLPARMGPGTVENFIFSFDINPEDTLWRNMQLQLDVAEVFEPGVLLIISDNSSYSPLSVNITTPGTYTIPLGDMSQMGTTGFVRFSTMDMPANNLAPVSFSFDSWGIYSIIQPVLGDMDLGDAPDPTYPTLINSDGARHLIVPGVKLGALIDGEADGQPTAQSSGDDINMPDDEDGVAFLWPLLPGNPCKIKVNASVGNALFNAWIDFNGNGSWSDQGDQIFSDLALLSGDNYLTFIVPLNAVAGQTHARFRFSHQPSLSFTGYAFDGEVEDYPVAIQPQGYKWQQLPDLALPGTHAHDMLMAADDFKCTGGQITQVAWWGNYELDAAQQEKRGQGINHFMVNLYNDINCLPMEPPLMSFIIPFSSITEVNTGLINNEGCPVYYYAYNLPNPFPQIQGNNYWVSVMAMPNNPVSPAIWRWQEANRWYYPILCGAANRNNPLPWQTILFGIPVRSMDLAFRITSVQASVEVDPDPMDNFVQNEISLALVPGSAPGIPTALVAAYNDQPYPGGPGLGVSHSFNGGATWTAQQLPYPLNPSGTPFLDAFDPTATADGNGNIYVAHISTDYDWTNGQESGLYIHKSTDGGVNWTGPYQISYDPKPVSSPDTNYRFNDRCQIVADINPSSPYYNTLYAVWIKDRGWQNPVPESDIYFSSSGDGGITWTPMLMINQRIHNLANMPNPAIAPDGTIYISWMDYNVTTGGAGTIYLNKSTNGGGTWLGSDIPVNTIPLPPLRLNGGTDVLAKGAPVIAVSPSNSQELYIVYAQRAGADEADIAFGKSTNGGQNWIFSQKINDDASLNDQVLPWMKVKPDGTIDIIWYDRRNDPSDLNWDVYMATSTDGGSSFLPNVKVSSIAAPSPMTPISGLWMGEYPGLAVDGGYAYVAYTSSLTDTKGDILFNKVPNPVANTDYGDAPDPMYPTFRTNNGASHTINPLIYLGNQVDPENDGLPDPIARGDDWQQLPDEDGITFNTALIPGQMASLTVQVSASGLFLQGWIDFNRNGNWTDPGEQIFSNVLTSSGFMSQSFQVPGYAITGNTFARFRVSTLAGLPFLGPAPDGEVEDYMVQLVMPMDYGDAPDPWYPTLSANNGASHMPVPGVMLGNLLDTETDGQPNASATGDNMNNQNDEDGVVFNTPLIGGLPATVTVQSSVGGFLLQGWIDFNGDGDWMDPMEQVCIDMPMVPGFNNLNFMVPLNTVSGSIYARFRLSSLPGLQFFGPAPDGEVEDYRILTLQTGYDFGDAPEPPYPTLLASNGPRHMLVQGIRLGALIDTEADGQPMLQSLGDDIVNLPDEDGVIFSSPVIPGQVASITLLPSAINLFMQGWIDFNANGSFTDPGEQILTNLVSTAGPNVVSFMVPPYAMTGQTTSRFRISSVPGLMDTGLAPDGEVEDHQVTIESGQPDEYDFGDAPDPSYPTLLGSDGARHMLNGATFLGNQVDSEPDGQPDPLALGDDNNNLMDEDGIQFSGQLLRGSPAFITVTVAGGGLLNGWLDFNRDGTWMQPAEQVFTDLYLAAGTHQLTFMIPGGAMAGPTYARFRLSNQPGLSFTGYAFDGEVEDYMVNINENPELKWQQLPTSTLPGLHSHDYINSTGIYEAVTKADDWVCNGGRITDIHWWGNYELLGNMEKRGAGIAHFRLSIHLDNATGLCLPADPEIWSVIVPFTSITEQFTGMFNNEGCKIYKYEFVLPVPFDQVAGTRYWLEVNAVSVNPNNPAIWRWQEALRGQNPVYCGATEKIIPVPATWYTIQWSAPDHFSDMAFALTNVPDKTLNLKLFLEGLYKGGGTMNKAQDEYGDHFAADTADLITIELHDDTTYSIIEYTVSNTKIDTSGIVQIVGIPYTLNGNYYITGKHRNSIETTTASPVSFTGNAISYDFSIAASQAYGNNQMNIGGVYVFYGGDENLDGIVDSSDMIDIDNDASNFVVGYVATDVNGDGLVDSSDMILVDNNAGNFVTAVLP